MDLSGYFLSRSRNVIPLRLRLRFTGQLQLFLFLVRLSSWHFSKGKGWPSRCSPGLKRSPSWPGNTRSAGEFLYQQVHTAEKALGAAFALSSRPDDVLYSYRSPRLGCGNWSWPWC